MAGKFRSFILFVFLAVFSGGLASAELATVHLKDGRSLTVELVSVDRGQVKWRISPAATQVQQFLRSQIEYVDFPPTNEWIGAEEAFQSGKVDEAISLYTRVISSPASQYYPMPGNFVSLAKVRLLECYRNRMDTEAIAAQAAIVRDEFSDLPPSYRRVAPEVAAWVAISKEKWQEGVEAVGNVEVPNPETYLVRGMAYEGMGALEEAIRQYAGAYVLNFGGPVDLTKTSLRRSAEMLAKLKNVDRQNELQGLVKIYQDLFGKGNLWEGAPEWLAKLAAGELVVMSELAKNIEVPEKPKSESDAIGQKSAALAGLPPIAERPWILTDELPERAYLVGPAEVEVTRTLNEGATQSESGYVFDGIGANVEISGFAASQPFVKIRADLTPGTTDGVIAEMQGGAGGFGLYLKKSEVRFAWAPKGSGVETFTLGKLEEGSRGNLTITCGGDRKISVNGLNQGEIKTYSLKSKSKGLEILDGQRVVLGDLHPQEPSNRGWEKNTPFKGIVHHFSVVSGKDGKHVKELERKAFKGKNPRFTPPPAKETLREQSNEEKK